MALPVQVGPDGEGGAVDQDHPIATNSVRCLEAFTNIASQLTHNQNVIARISILFKQPNVDKVILTPDDIHDSHEQFMVWNRNLGVFASDHGSLDFRLGGAEDVRDSIVLLLQNLRVDLSTCSQLLEKDRSTVSNDDCDTSSDSSTSSNADRELDTLSSSTTKKTVYELQIRISHVVEVVNKLIKLASVIRASGSRSRMTRALAYEHVQDGVNVTEQFEKHYLPKVLEHRFGLTGEILSRFVRAISLRRKHFLYQSRHQKRLAYNSGLPAETVQDVPVPKFGATKAAIEPNTLISAQTNQKSAITQTLSDLNPPTKATTFRTLQSEKKAPSRLTSGSTKVDKNDHEIPPPPPVKDRATHFECPYCCTLIPREKHEPKYWRAHVIADLKPFICLEPDCLNPDVLLESQGHWVEHQKWEHALEWWCDGIDNEHTARCFTSEEVFAQHLRHAHKGTMSSQAINSEITIAGRPSLTPFSCCPLCDFSPVQSDQLEPIPMMNSGTHLTYSQSQLQKHIANEMLGIFLTALPDRDDIDCPAVESAIQGGNRSTLLAMSTVSPCTNNRNLYTVEPRGEDLTIPAKWYTLPNEEDIHFDPFDIFFDELWNDVWTSPLLREGIRATYVGLSNDNLLTQWQATEKYLATFVDSLYFEDMNTRYHSIKAADDKSFRWLFQCAEYREWLDSGKLSEHHGLFWIKGKPGSGKSTMMKFFSSATRLDTERSVKIKFFFNASGRTLEKSAAGMYRSLLFQLLREMPDLRSVINIPRLTTDELVSIQWSSYQLQTFLIDVVKGLGKRSLAWFIDALDECDESEHREIVRFFEFTAQIGVTSGAEFRVCFSSRHYPAVSCQKGFSIILEQRTMPSIITYVRQNLVADRETEIETLQEEIAEVSGGNFLWVELVVPILQYIYDLGGSGSDVRKRLQEIPSDLYNLYESIVGRQSLHSEEMNLSFLCVLYAQRPLTPKELYIAMMIGTNFENEKIWNSNEVSEDRIIRFITSCSGGLIEVTRGSISKVQFIHESVREYFISRETVSNIETKGASEIFRPLHQSVRQFLLQDGISRTAMSMLSTISMGEAHDRLRQYCQRYCESEFITAFLNVNSLQPTASSQEAAILRELACQTFPFLDYATRYLLCHGDIAQSFGCSQVDFLDKFAISQWAMVDNLLERYRVRRRSKNVSLLYILAEKDLPSLIELEMNRISCMDIPGERYGLPLLAAKELRNPAALRAMLSYRPPKNSQDENDQPLPSAEEIDKAVDILLVARPLNWKHGETPIKWAVKNGLEPLIKCLLATKRVSYDADLDLGASSIVGETPEKDNV